jgi:hypothetical protein
MNGPAQTNWYRAAFSKSVDPATTPSRVEARLDRRRSGGYVGRRPFYVIDSFAFFTSTFGAATVVGASVVFVGGLAYLHR